MMENPDYKKIIRELMGDYRYEHSVNVADEAVKLAKLYGDDVDKAYTTSQRRYPRTVSCKLLMTVV